METVEIAENAFDDDLVIYARNESLQNNLNIWELQSKRETWKLMSIKLKS